MTDGSSRRAARGVDALRRGWPIRIDTLHLIAVEACSQSEFARFIRLAGSSSSRRSLDISSRSDLLISAERAVTLKLVNQRAAAAAQPGAAPQAVRLSGAVDSLAAALAIADPSCDLHFPLKGPFSVIAAGDAATTRAAVILARHAGLLPAFLVADTHESLGLEPEAELQAKDVTTLLDPQQIRIAARARLPIAVKTNSDKNRESNTLAVGINTEIIAFRSPDDPLDHIALILGERDSSLPSVRLHSECLTGDVLGSLKCDCGPQLHHALAAMADARWGVLLYLRQEGRGIGLVNKLRAYAMQDQGYDTLDANVRLGFPVEARDFSIAAHMLVLLGIDAVRLMTNNPEKVAQLRRQGIDVRERLSLAMPANPHNEQYLATKRERSGHQL